MVLVRVRSAGVKPVDYKICRGGLAGAFPFHFPLVPGRNVAGVVEAVGPAVSEFSVGDEVVGYVRRDHRALWAAMHRRAGCPGMVSG